MKPKPRFRKGKKAFNKGLKNTLAKRYARTIEAYQVYRIESAKTAIRIAAAVMQVGLIKSRLLQIAGTQMDPKQKILLNAQVLMDGYFGIQKSFQIL